MTELLFWSCVGFAAYAYFGYPVAVALVARLRPRLIRREPITPSVSFIITAHNEQTRIESKILNTLAIDYPPDRLEIIVASDCSTDETHAIVGRYAAQGVRLIVSPRRGGKEVAQGLAVTESRGEVLVFSDVATQLEPGGVRAILLPFADATVGCVSSVDRVVDRDGKVTGEGAYVRYEMLLRSLESQRRNRGRTQWIVLCGAARGLSAMDGRFAERLHHSAEYTQARDARRLGAGRARLLQKRRG